MFKLVLIRFSSNRFPDAPEEAGERHLRPGKTLPAYALKGVMAVLFMWGCVDVTVCIVDVLMG